MSKGFEYLCKCKNCGQLIVYVQSVHEPQQILDGVEQNGSYTSSIDTFYDYVDSYSHPKKKERLNSIIGKFPFLYPKDISNDSCLYTVVPGLEDLFERSLSKYKNDNVVFAYGKYTTYEEDFIKNTCPVCNTNNIYKTIYISHSKQGDNPHSFVFYKTDLTASDTSHPYNYDTIDRKEIQDLIDSDNIQTCTPEYTELIQNCEASVDKSIILENSNNATLQTYLKGLLEIKTIEYSLETRLKELVLQKFIANQDFINAECKISKNEIDSIRNKLASVNKEIEQRTSKDRFVVPSTWYFECGIEKPIQPIKPKEFTMTAPTEPEYKKPGLFNKKAILAENEELKNRYDAALKEYNSQKDSSEREQIEYQRSFIEYQEKEKYFKYKKEEYAQKAYDVWKNNLIANDTNLQKLMREQEEYKEIVNNPKEYQKEKMQNLPATLIKDLTDEEIKQCVSSLKDAYQAEHDYLSPGILFPKYATLPAVTTMYEYFVTGRCSEFTGPNGAYNLYESELRQNTIIEKLDVITYKLDEIKANQYTLYQAMQSVNAQLSSLNNAANNITKQLGTMNNTLSNIDSNVSDIRTLSSVTAYNTAVTAYYSKANAELTNSLGYLIAMK